MLACAFSKGSFSGINATPCATNYVTIFNKYNENLKFQTLLGIKGKKFSYTSKNMLMDIYLIAMTVR